MSGEHTPGPWSYRPQEHDDWGVVRAGKSIICQARDPRAWSEEQLNEHRRAGTDPWEANARLIAASPDLLAAAEKVLAGLNARIDAAVPSAVPVFDGIVELHDAIAKARRPATQEGGAREGER